MRRLTPHVAESCRPHLTSDASLLFSVPSRVLLQFVMVHYKLTYFPLRLRAETARQLFALAGVEFKNVLLTNEQWPELKPCEFQS